MSDVGHNDPPAQARTAEPHKKKVDWTFKRPLLYPMQEAAIFDKRRVSIIEASTKSGKTAGCITWLLDEAMMSGKPGKNYWWVAPVSLQARIAFDRMRHSLPRNLIVVHLSDKRITLRNGAEIWFKSGDHPDTLYGEDVYAAVIDEASRLKEESWHAVRSTLTATRGRIRIIGNVKGKKNWFYQLARRAEAGQAPNAGFHRLTAKDAVSAGVLEAREILEAKQDLPESVFRELYLAQASDDEGNPFGYADIQACIAPLSSAPPVCWGWDLARKRNWTVGIGIDRDGNVCRFHRFQLPWAAQIERIVEATGRVPAFVDSTGVGDAITEFLIKRLGETLMGYKFTGPSKQTIMEGLALAISSRAVHYPDGPIPFELRQFEYTYTRTGVIYSAPEGFDDDCVCALALAWHKFKNRGYVYNLDAMIT